jgi:hypothetical protein
LLARRPDERHQSRHRRERSNQDQEGAQAPRKPEAEQSFDRARQDKSGEHGERDGYEGRMRHVEQPTNQKQQNSLAGIEFPKALEGFRQTVEF